VIRVYSSISKKEQLDNENIDETRNCLFIGEYAFRLRELVHTHKHVIRGDLSHYSLSG
jgi:hypothetical protein